jgi:hypothetical protein
VEKSQPDDLDAVRAVSEALAPFENQDKERILRWVREKLGLAAPVTPLALHPASPGMPGTLTPSHGGSTTSSIRSFVEKKKPQFDTHFAATVAYYYRFEAPEDQRKESITTNDLQEACRLANRERLQNPVKTLNNAHAQGLLDRGERGAYSINTVGENLVAMTLPSDATSGARKQSRKKSAKKRNGRKTNKARKRSSRKH